MPNFKLSPSLSNFCVSTQLLGDLPQDCGFWASLQSENSISKINLLVHNERSHVSRIHPDNFCYW